MNKDALRNIDAQIAEVVYQIEVFYDEGELFDTDCNTILFWSTSISCTWGLIKKLQDDHYIQLFWDAYAKDWSCTIEVANKENVPLIESRAGTAPLAICKAVLKLYEKEQC